MQRLRGKIRSLEGGAYKQYKSLQGEYSFPGFILSVDHVQGDPFALASRISIHISHKSASLPKHLWSQKPRKRACEDYLARAVDRLIREFVTRQCGTGHSGQVEISTNAQQVLDRNCLLLHPEGLEVRMTVGLPGDGRKILAKEAENILCDNIPKVIEGALFYENISASDIESHVYAIEDQVALRAQLDQNNLIAFVADGAHLPRQSGIDDRPLLDQTIAITAPESLAVEMRLPNSGVVRGLGIPKGVTVIVGGGFHGKSTLLHALERGVYDHIPGDGREQVVTVGNAMKVRAEDGRSISNLDIRGFINHLPFGRDTASFSTENASGSTSQAANIIEALQSGTKVLLIDEDTSATNFMIRDERMQKLVVDEKEPITPLLHQVRHLYETHGVSSVIVMGGSGDYLSVADTVIMMDSYQVKDVTKRASELAETLAPHPVVSNLSLNSSRHPVLDALSAKRNNKDKITTHKTRELVFGEFAVDVSKLEQLVDNAQLEAIGWMLCDYAKHTGTEASAVEGLSQVVKKLEEEGLDGFTPYERMGNFAVPRIQELLGVLNRFRGIAWSD